MRERIKLLTLAILTAFGLGVSSLQPAYALDVVGDACAANPNSTICKGQNDDATAMMKVVINVLLMILGMIAVIMIIIGGFRYVLSNGDSSSITSAKNTILYSVIGLVVAISAWAIVNFVVEAFK